ncbi:MAG: signal peptidase II, partial [Nevskiales bacterium]
LRTVVSGLFNLTYVRNRGAAFGLFNDYESSAVQLLLVGFSLAALGLVVVLLWRGAASAAAGWGLALIFGGAMGNLLDRIRTGSVVDFLDFYLGSYHWPAFNVADSSIVIGAGLLLLQVVRKRGTALHPEAREA